MTGTVVGIAMAKDEEEIVGTTVSWMLTQVDHVIVADNMSDDGTRKILDEIAAENDRLTVVDDFEKGYYQGAKMTALARQAHVKFGADWCVPWDIDEFWFSPFGRIGDILPTFGEQWLVVEAQLYDHMATGVDNPDKVDPIDRMRWRRRAENPLRKVACRWREDLVIAQGNHSASYNGGASIYGAELVIRHFPYRSPSQMVRKVRNGAAAYKAGENIPVDQGVHWREWGELLNTQGEQAIHDLFYRWYYREDPTATLTVDGQVLPPLKLDPARQAAMAGA